MAWKLKNVQTKSFVGQLGYKKANTSGISNPAPSKALLLCSKLLKANHILTSRSRPWSYSFPFFLQMEPECVQLCVGPGEWQDSEIPTVAWGSSPLALMQYGILSYSEIYLTPAYGYFSDPLQSTHSILFGVYAYLHMYFCCCSFRNSLLENDVSFATWLYKYFLPSSGFEYGFLSLNFSKLDIIIF